MRYWGDFVNGLFVGLVLMWLCKTAFNKNDCGLAIGYAKDISASIDSIDSSFKMLCKPISIEELVVTNSPQSWMCFPETEARKPEEFDCPYCKNRLHWSNYFGEYLKTRNGWIAGCGGGE